jgi:ribosomal protein L11 methyltransferase
LDFGSGSGILSIAAAAHLGAHVDAVEIDARAIEHARGNLLLNGVGNRVRLLRDLAETTGQYELIVANILRDVLLAHADALTERLDAPGTLILSGLVSTDVPELGARYAARFDVRPEIYARDEWRALVFRRGSHAPPE